MKNKHIGKLDSEDSNDTGHSLLSSIIYMDYFLDRMNRSLGLNKVEKRVLRRLIWQNAFIISRHHSDLCQIDSYLDSFENSAGRLVQAISKQELTGVIKLRYLEVDEMGKYITQYRKACENSEREHDIAHYFYCRFAYSILVACDYYATTEYVNNMEIKDFGHADYTTIHQSYENTQLMESIRLYEKTKYGNHSWIDSDEINDLRCEMFLDAEKEIKDTSEDILFLEAPTGGGKSNIAMNLSFYLLQNKKKLFYIYPFNTLVEQNYNTLMKSFADKSIQNQIAVVNSITPIKGKENREDSPVQYYQRALLDRQFLNYPFILSTHVSLFSVLFSHRREDVFAFYQLTDSVLVLDEIQSYRNAIWAEIMIFIKECAEVMGMKVIIMSATLPGLDYLTGYSCTVKRLLKNADDYFQHKLFRNRVRISYDLLQEDITLDALRYHVMENKGKRLLVTFIKKDSAYAFYDLICREDLGETQVKLITGDDSMYDREQILGPIRDNKVSDIILISTQVIEAGVDIDMDIGYKDISKLDSEEQFLGRINRSCKKEGFVYFFNMDTASRIYKDDYRIAPDLTLLEEEMQIVLEDKRFSHYYEKVMTRLKEKQNESTSKEGLTAFFLESVKKLNFPDIEERMQLIQEDNWSMNVVLCRTLELDNGEKLEGVKIWEEYKSLLHNFELEYAEKSVKLTEIRSKLNHFIYRIKKNPNLYYHDMLGELICLYDGEKYFKNGKLDKKKLETGGLLFFD